MISKISKIRVAILGCGMMGQEHISYLNLLDDVVILYLSDPCLSSIEKAMKMCPSATAIDSDDLFSESFDILVIASPNHTHTPLLLKWGLRSDLIILCEKPVAVNWNQLNQLKQAKLHAKIWIGMEYRYMPPIAKLIKSVVDVGAIQSIVIRELRYPFLHKIDKWNRDIEKSGNTLVEKCCHFFDLFFHIAGCNKIIDIYASTRDNINYLMEEEVTNNIIDSAHVMFRLANGIDCILELCMYAEGSRNQEEVCVTGSSGRIEAYLPESKVDIYHRPDHNQWSDRTIPPPAVKAVEIDCDQKDVKLIHQGYHYGSTFEAWTRLLSARSKKDFKAEVTLSDGIVAVESALLATDAANDVKMRCTAYEKLQKK